MSAVPSVFLLRGPAKEPPFGGRGDSLITAEGVVNPGPHWDVLIRWGNLDGDDRTARRVLNRRAALAAALDQGRAAELLARSGLRVERNSDGGRVRAREHYRVHAFDFQLVSLGQREPGRYGFQEIAGDSSRLAEKAVRYAYRALYALGLDFGAVDVVVNNRGKLAVLNVDPQPSVGGRLAERYAACLRQYLDDLAPALYPNVKLGADPEFMVHGENGQMVPASRFFPTAGSVGCDAIFIRTPQGGISRPLGELRPPPSDSPDELVRSLRRLLARAVALAPYANLQFRAGSLPFAGFPIGGHIHFSGLGRVSGQLLRALDTYLMIPLFLVEDQTTARLRRPRYGFLGDQRPQPHGFEYRTPASWLISPRIARAALALAKVVAMHHRQLTHDAFVDIDLVDHFYAGDKEPFYPLAAAIFSELSELSAYQKYAADIEPLRRMVEQRRQWDESVDIRRTWKIPIPQQVYTG